MKTLSLFIIVIITASNTFSQNGVPQNIVVEHFTNTRCSVCASRNPGFYNTLQQNPGVLHIAYHPSSPYDECLFSTQNTLENDARTNYYSLYGSTPKFKINGITKNAIEVQQDSVYNAFENQTSDFEINTQINALGTDSIQVNVIISSQRVHSYSNLNLFVALVEDTVFYQAPNGEDLHYDVFRKSFSGANPLLIDAPQNIGSEYAYTATLKADSIWDLNRLYALAILQTPNASVVVQAQRSSLLDPENINVSTQNKVLTTNFLVYPNPAKDQLHISTVFHTQKSNPIIYNSLGAQILIPITKEGDEYILNIQGLPHGVYAVELENERKIFIKD